MRSKKLYTVKQWARFKKTLVKENQSIKHNVDIQELMCKNFDIILIDYMTSRERKIQMIKTFFEKVKSTLQGIKSALDKLHESCSGAERAPREDRRARECEGPHLSRRGVRDGEGRHRGQDGRDDGGRQVGRVRQAQL